MDLVRLVRIPVEVNEGDFKAHGYVVAAGRQVIVVQVGLVRATARSSGSKYAGDDGLLTSAGMKVARSLVRRVCDKQRSGGLRAATATIVAELARAGLRPLDPTELGRIADARREVRAVARRGDLTPTDERQQVAALEKRRREAHGRHGQFLVACHERLKQMGFDVGMREVEGMTSETPQPPADAGQLVRFPAREPAG